MKATRYHILLALAESPAHGAEIRRRVEEGSRGEVTLYPAMLYGTLDELTSAGWIVELDGTEVDKEYERWRVYALTPEGRLALEAETSRLEEVVGHARAVLEAAEGG